MKKQRVLIPHSTKTFPHHLALEGGGGGGGGGGGSAPYDIGLQTEIGRTSKGGSAALPEESPTPTVDKGGEETPTFKVLPRAGGQPSGEA